MLSFTADHAGDYYVNCRGNYVTKIRFYKNGQEIAYDRYQIQIFHLGQLEAGDYISIEYEYSNVSGSEVAPFYVATFHPEAFENVYRELTNHMLDVETVKDGYIYGTIEMPENKTLFTSIPYDEGWTVKVDGKKVDYYKVAVAFIGVDMDAGTHTIEFSYMPQGMLPGILISILCMVILMISLQVEKKLEMRRSEKSNACGADENADEKLAEEVETDIENLENV